MTTVVNGDCRKILRMMDDNDMDCCVTSPPYFGLRDYGVEGQIGLEQTPDEYVAQMVEVFREVRRVLKPEGTLWLNLGDSYASYRDSKATPDTTRGNSTGALVPKGEAKNRMASTFKGSAIKHKDLIGIPWRVAFALQADGWYLRQDIIWHKPNPMPESVKDRCTKSHEYIFLLSKSERYYFDSEAIAEPVAASTVARLSQENLENQVGSDRVPGKTNGNMKAVGGTETRNKRDVWTVCTKPYKGAHFATFPPDLVRPCILAGCPKDGTVLDPFGGSGTTGQVAHEEGRHSFLIELNPKYIPLIETRTATVRRETSKLS
ncbi:MAG: site-specific DNA-methyltransferase [Sphaerochaetaceae bacterium]